MRRPACRPRRRGLARSSINALSIVRDHERPSSPDHDAADARSRQAEIFNSTSSSRRRHRPGPNRSGARPDHRIAPPGGGWRRDGIPSPIHDTGARLSTDRSIAKQTVRGALVTFRRGDGVGGGAAHASASIPWRRAPRSRSGAPRPEPGVHGRSRCTFTACPVRRPGGRGFRILAAAGCAIRPGGGKRDH